MVNRKCPECKGPTVVPTLDPTKFYCRACKKVTYTKEVTA